MLNKTDENRLLDWVNRQKEIIKSNMGIDISFEIGLDMNKSVVENKNILAEKIKQAVLDTQSLIVDNSIKKLKIKNPFEKISNAEYKNIMRQLTELEQQDIAFSVSDVGKDATEEIVLDYFKANYGLILKTLEQSRTNPKEELKCQEAEYEAQIKRQQEEADKRLQEKAKAIMQNGGCELLDKAEEIYNYFKEQNLGCEHITLLTQFSLFGLSTKFLFDGLPGTGKSRSAVEQIERFIGKIGSERIKIVSGHITPLRAYLLLYRYKDKKDLLVCDESFFLINNKEIQQLFKDALFRGIVYWESGKLPDGIPNQFEWKANIILNTNSFGKDDAHTKAFLDRLMVFKINLSNEQIVRKIMSSRSFQFNDILEKEMADRIITVRSGEVINEITEQDKDYFYQLIANEVQRMSKNFSNISFRTLQKCELLYRCFKLYFGGFNEFTKEWYQHIACEIIKGNSTENFIVSAIKSTTKGQIKSSELVQLIQDHYGIQRTQSYEKIRELKEAGFIEGDRVLLLKNGV